MRGPGPGATGIIVPAARAHPGSRGGGREGPSGAGERRGDGQLGHVVTLLDRNKVRKIERRTLEFISIFKL